MKLLSSYSVFYFLIPSPKGGEPDGDFRSTSGTLFASACSGVDFALRRTVPEKEVV